MHRLKLNNDGFSLVELLLTLALMILFIGSMGSFTLSWQRQVYVDFKEVQLYNDFRYALHVVTHYLRRAVDCEIYEDNSLRYEIHLMDVNNETIKFGHHKGEGTLWRQKSVNPMCSHVKHFSVDLEEFPLVTLCIESNAQISGIEGVLPLKIESKILLRNAIKQE